MSVGYRGYQVSLNCCLCSDYISFYTLFSTHASTICLNNLPRLHPTDQDALTCSRPTTSPALSGPCQLCALERHERVPWTLENFCADEHALYLIASRDSCCRVGFSHTPDKREDRRKWHTTIEPQNLAPASTMRTVSMNPAPASSAATCMRSIRATSGCASSSSRRHAAPLYVPHAQLNSQSNERR
jgi:hypothetical protein